MGHQLFRIGQLHDIALVDDGDAVRNVPHDREVVGDEQVGDAALLLQMAQQVEHLGADGHIQSRDGLVGNDELRLHDQGAGNADALALAAGELMRETGSEFRQQAHIQQCLPDLLLPLGGGQVGPDILQALAHDVADLGTLVQGGLRVLEDHLDLLDDLLVQLAGNLAVDLLALVQDLAARGGQDAHDGAADGGLAGAGFAHQTKGLTLVNFKVGTVHGLEGLAAGAVGHLEVLDLKQDLPGRSLSILLAQDRFFVRTPRRGVRCFANANVTIFRHPASPPLSTV